METIDISRIKHIHFVGIKGVAMTALACLAKQRGITVTGSDLPELFPTDEVLKASNINVFEDFSPEHVAGDLVVYTGAHQGQDNREVVEARRRTIPTLPHGKALGLFMNGKKQISIAGCHGKTTTTAMLALIFEHAGLQPSYAVGSGIVRGLGMPGKYGDGEWFIAEADEYSTDPGHDNTPRFMWQSPTILVVTTIDYDHPDVYGSLEEIGTAYKTFAEQAKPRVVIARADDKNSVVFLQSVPNMQWYGASGTDLIVKKGIQKPHNNSCTFYYNNTQIELSLSVPGVHNCMNAAAAFLAATYAGIAPETIVEALKLFNGASRRFEYLRESDTQIVIDDYAHHPEEIRATLSAVREWYPKWNLNVVFQPHTYSRTAAMLDQFGLAFSLADTVSVLPIYASAREKAQAITNNDVVGEIKKHRSSVRPVRSISDFFTLNSDFSGKNDIILTLGAGDIGKQIRGYIDERA